MKEEEHRYSSVLGPATGVITYLFAAFGGFLFDFAPPAETHVGLAVGVSCTISLSLLLGISLFSRSYRDTVNLRSVWLSSGFVGLLFAVILAFNYSNLLQKHTFVWPTQEGVKRFVSGKELTPKAISTVETEFNGILPDPATLLDEITDFRKRHLVWKQDSIDDMATTLNWTYILTTVLFGVSIFSFCEGLTSSKTKKAS